MSRDWTPKEWDLIHKNNPDLINLFDGVVWASNGQTTPLLSKEELAFYRKYPKLNLVGRGLLELCYGKGMEETLEQVEAALNGAENELSDRVKLWYEGQLMPGRYMDGNNMAMYERMAEWFTR